MDMIQKYSSIKSRLEDLHYIDKSMLMQTPYCCHKVKHTRLYSMCLYAASLKKKKTLETKRLKPIPA